MNTLVESLNKKAQELEDYYTARIDSDGLEFSVCAEYEQTKPQYYTWDINLIFTRKNDTRVLKICGHTFFYNSSELPEIPSVVKVLDKKLAELLRDWDTPFKQKRIPAALELQEAIARHHPRIKNEQ